MKRVIIYGVKNLELRREAEYFLDDGYEIVGYSDGHYRLDIWDGKRFIPPEELCHEEFDLILLNAGSEATREEMRQYLLDIGIPTGKIVGSVLLSNAKAKVRPDLIADIDSNYHGEKGLIFGLSYSLHGINKELLKFPFYDCSSFSLDLYYNYQLYNYMEQRWGPDLCLETVLWVFPYYYFDYDASRSIGFHQLGHLFSLWRLDDWHNYQDDPAFYDYIENYRMFGNKLSRFYHSAKERPVFFHNVCCDPKGTQELSRLFFTEHKETERENREIFVQFYKKIEARGTKPVLVIPPYCMDTINESSKRAFKTKRERFYRILRELEPEIGAVKVLDCSERYAWQRGLYAEKRHLNEDGAREFTGLINRELL